eukprot:GHVT01080715.1.p1 GENE.GHVT01080715.1~~GHVT01080715.1.p1  ORF type:complete len:281 (+),score=23.60 GHVT01080715.1:2237-3079(+)
MKLFCGIFCILMSVLWVAHTIAYVVIPHIMGVDVTKEKWFGLLDAFLEILAKADLALLALVLYGLLISYLLICTMHGCFKFGMRIFCCFSIHPMRKGETHLNSLLFNVAMLLVASSAVVQFSQQVFRAFSKLTVASWMFQVQMEIMPFFGVFFRYNIFVYLWLVVGGLCLLYLVCKPRDKMALDLNFKGLPDNVRDRAEQEMARLSVDLGAKSAEEEKGSTSSRKRSAWGLGGVFKGGHKGKRVDVPKKVPTAKKLEDLDGPQVIGRKQLGDMSPSPLND